MNICDIKIKNTPVDDGAIGIPSGPGVIGVGSRTETFIDELKFFYAIGKQGYKGSCLWYVETDEGTIMFSPIYKGENKEMAAYKNGVMFIGDIVMDGQYSIKNPRCIGKAPDIQLSKTSPHFAGYRTVQAQDSENNHNDLYFLAFVNNAGLVDHEKDKTKFVPSVCLEVAKFFFEDSGIHRGYFISNVMWSYVYFKNTVQECYADEYDGCTHFIKPFVVYDRGQYTPPKLKRIV